MQAEVIIFLFFVFMFLGIPVVVSLGVTSVIYLLTIGISPIVVVQQMLNSMDKFTLLAIPFFIMAGGIMQEGGISKRIVMFSKKLMGPLPGGLALVVVGASMMFASMTGAGAATCAAIGSIMLPEMKKDGYDENFSAALQSSAGIFGPIIPPSILMVIYAIATDTSVGDMLLAGVIPGIVLGLIMMVITFRICVKRGYKGEGHFSFKELVKSFIDAFWALLTPIIILGGIYTGFFTPTETAAVATLYSILVGMFIYKSLTFKKTLSILYGSMKLAAGILLIVAVTQAFGWILTREQIPQLVAAFFSGVSQNPIVFLFLVFFMLLITGMFIDAVPACSIFAPIITPAAIMLGIDTVHFGIVMVVSLCIGLITPPVGMNLFVVSSISNIPVHKITRDLGPFLIASFIGIVVIILFPQLSTFLPRLINA
ncbi:MAG: TRAP transporter large permease [Sphaerochaetaceae bacterium]|nr:TRAP transporter large permease [uncultured Sphaerochaeta sp.]MDC7230651.1 TRAP transporter large permease [Sphaerochaetaceae bacterium]